MPVVDSAGCDTADVGSGFPNNRETAFELADAVCLAESREVGAGAWLAVGGLEGVDLLEEIKVAFVAAFEGLVGLFSAENLHGTLYDEKGSEEGWKGFEGEAPLANTSFLLHGEHSNDLLDRDPLAS